MKPYVLKSESSSILWAPSAEIRNQSNDIIMSYYPALVTGTIRARDSMSALRLGSR